MEHQRQENKHKFEDPYFIKVGGPSEDRADSGLKIVKHREGSDSDEEPTQQKKLKKTKTMAVRGQVVTEAKESEEQSPDIRGLKGSR